LAEKGTKGGYEMTTKTETEKLGRIPLKPEKMDRIPLKLPKKRRSRSYSQVIADRQFLF
jgi:hypothetical protein